MIYSMLRASAIDQHSEDKLCVDPGNLREDGFGPNPRFHCLLAESDGEPAGLALYYFTYSTWNSRNGLYLEDLYVGPKFRRTGVGRALMDELVKVGRAMEGTRIHWLVLRDNERALTFYRSLGAQRVNADVWVMQTELRA